MDDYRQQQIDVLKEAVPYSEKLIGAIVVAYVLAKENEIKTVRIILTARLNGLEEEQIRERIREMYV